MIRIIQRLGLSVAVLLLGVQCSCAQNASSAAASPGAAGKFVHPGGLHKQADLDRMRAKVAAGEHPWIDSWNILITDRRAQNNYRPAPKPNMGASRQRAQDDASAAYLNAIRWYISGDTSFADCAVRNLNSWAATVDQVLHGPDQPGLSGIPIGTFAVAAEVLRIYPGWAEADQAKLKAMLVKYCYPVCHDFLINHNGADPTRYWANWDTANILAVTAIGVFCDDRAKFDEGIEYFKNGAGMGSIKNAVPFLYPDGLGQWQESGRDHAHALGGMGLAAEACQVAWNQGVDLFGYSNNRLLAGAEYEAQYTQWKGVPYRFYTNADEARQYYISPAYRGRLQNCEYLELLYNHYVVQKGLAAPNVKRFAELIRPEHGNADILGYGTLTFTLDGSRSPYPASPTPPAPQDVTATAGVGRIDLKWSPSGAYSTRGYKVSRSMSADGPYTEIASWQDNTVPLFTDSQVVAGTTYYYVVSAMNQSGTSANSTPVSASPAAAGALPDGWSQADIGAPTVAGTGQYSSAGNQTFIVVGEGTGIGETSDHCHFVYRTVTGDFCITARVLGIGGRTDKAGLMIRETTAADSIAFAMTKGEKGGRQARFRSRSTVGGQMSVQLGNDYTWTPAWFRLRREGNRVTASQSFDGSTWFEVGASEVLMAKTYLVGIATSSGGSKGELSTVTFDHVRAEIAPPAVPVKPSELTASATADSIQLKWTMPNSNEDGFKVEHSIDGENWYEIADLKAGTIHFMNTGLASTGHQYRVRAYNTGGLSTYSNVAGATLTGGSKTGMTGK